MQIRLKKRGAGSLVWFLFLSGILLLTGCGVNRAEKTETVSVGQEHTGMDPKEEKGNGELSIHFIDVGQGDATLILQDGHAMLIDAGNNDKGTLLQGYFKSLGVRSFDYIIGTHPDSDHIGGMDVILYKFPCKNMIMGSFDKDTRTYQEVVETLQEKHIKQTLPVVFDTYPFADAEFTIVSPVTDRYGDGNSGSVGVFLRYGKNTFLFTGDAEEDAEQDMLDAGVPLDADVFKASHHGSDTANTEEFLNEVSPKYAVISCGEGNSYGHPHAEVLNRFRKMGVQVFRTDEQGTVVLTSDGTKISFNMSPDESWKAGEREGSQAASKNMFGKQSKKNLQKEIKKERDSSEISNRGKTYILNTNTRKYHLPDCYSVSRIDAEHKEEMRASESELIELGYSGCGNCIGH